MPMQTEHSTTGERGEVALGPPVVTFLVGADALREIEATLRKRAVPKPGLAELLARPRPE